MWYNSNYNIRSFVLRHQNLAINLKPVQPILPIIYSLEQILDTMGAGDQI